MSHHDWEIAVLHDMSTLFDRRSQSSRCEPSRSSQRSRCSQRTRCERRRRPPFAVLSASLPSGIMSSDGGGQSPGALANTRTDEPAVSARPRRARKEPKRYEEYDYNFTLEGEEEDDEKEARDRSRSPARRSYNFKKQQVSALLAHNQLHLHPHLLPSCSMDRANGGCPARPVASVDNARCRVPHK